MLIARPEPQVTIVHQEFHAVLFGCYRVRLGNLQNFEARNIELEPAWRASVGANRARDDYRGFLSKRLKVLPYLLGDALLEYHSLDDARTIANLWKHQLAA